MIQTEGRVMRDRNFWLAVVVFALGSGVLPLLAWLFMMPPNGDYSLIIMAVPAAVVVGCVAGKRYRKARGPIGMGLTTMFESTLWIVALTFACGLMVAWQMTGLLIAVALMASLAVLLPCLLAAFVLSATGAIPPVGEEWRWFWSNRS